jgi:DNA-binding response OmpR family regulator
MNKKKVLIIDDSFSCLLLLQSLLEENQNLIVQVENDSTKALNRIADIKPNVIILDLMMPDIDGFQILNQIKTSQELKDIPIIILSALQDHKTKIKATTLGAIDFMEKPVNFDEVTKKIATYLGL